MPTRLLPAISRVNLSPTLLLRAAVACCFPALVPIVSPPRDTPIIRRHDVADARYLELGTGYASIAHLRLPVPSGAADGEGTLIAPQWVLTAAHLAEFIEVGHRISVGDSFFTVAAVIPHPDWDGGAHDLALVQLAEPVHHVTPAHVYRGDDELDRVLVLVGYGDHGTGLTGAEGNDWQVRGATNRVDEATAFWLKMRFDAPGDPRVTPLEGVSGGGDSGGPAYLEHAGREVIAGVSAAQSTRATGGLSGRYGVVEHYTRVSRYVTWIESITGPLPGQ